MLHLSQSFGLITTCLTENSTIDIERSAIVEISTCHLWVSIGIPNSDSILVLTVSVHTLHVEIATIKAICQVINVIEHISLCTSRLVVDFDLIDKTSALHLEIWVKSPWDAPYMLNCIGFLLEFLVLLKSWSKNLLSCATPTLLLAVKFTSAKSAIHFIWKVAFEVGSKSDILIRANFELLCIFIDQATRFYIFTCTAFWIECSIRQIYILHVFTVLPIDWYL